VVYVVNALGTLTVALCAWLLLRAYARVHKRLLLWSGLCFAGLTLSNSLFFLGLPVFPGRDVYTVRLAVAAVSVLVLLYGLVLDSD
jgi:hypothetical protein